MELTVNLGADTYPIYIENNILERSGEYISRFFSGKKIMIISDDNVFPLYGSKLISSLTSYECHSLVLPHGETTKSFQTLPRIYSELLKAKLTRSDLIIALGGGCLHEDECPETVLASDPGRMYGGIRSVYGQCLCPVQAFRP